MLKNVRHIIETRYRNGPSFQFSKIIYCSYKKTILVRPPLEFYHSNSLSFRRELKGMVEGLPIYPCKINVPKTIGEFTRFLKLCCRSNKFGSSEITIFEGRSLFSIEDQDQLVWFPFSAGGCRTTIWNQ